MCSTADVVVGVGGGGVNIRILYCIYRSTFPKLRLSLGNFIFLKLRLHVGRVAREPRVWFIG